jgi:hypothetical protein
MAEVTSIKAIWTIEIYPRVAVTNARIQVQALSHGESHCSGFLPITSNNQSIMGLNLGSECKFLERVTWSKYTTSEATSS